jgi:hypothetical protein
MFKGIVEGDYLVLYSWNVYKSYLHINLKVKVMINNFKYLVRSTGKREIKGKYSPLIGKPYYTILSMDKLDDYSYSGRTSYEEFKETKDILSEHEK